MKIILKRDWDIPISSPLYAVSHGSEQRQDNGHYGGRETEVKQRTPLQAAGIH